MSLSRYSKSFFSLRSAYHRLDPNPFSIIRNASTTVQPSTAAATAAASNATGNELNKKSSIIGENLTGDPALNAKPSNPSISPSLNRFIQALQIFTGLTFVSSSALVAYATYAYETENLEEKISEARTKLPSKTEDENSSNALSFQDSVSSTLGHAALDVADQYVKYRKIVEEYINGISAPTSDRLLPDLPPLEQGVYTLVIDPNVLIHNEWKRDRGWRTFKRPGVDAFLEHLARAYEIVTFSDQSFLSFGTILDRLDSKGFIRFRLYREATQYKKGVHYRDLSKLNRDARKVLYLTSEDSSCLQKENVLHVPQWDLNNSKDTALLDLLPFFDCLRNTRPDVRAVVASYSGQDIATTFKERAKQQQTKKQQEKKSSGISRFLGRGS